MESGSDCAFMCCADAVVFLEFGVVVFDGFVGGFDVEMWHGFVVFSTVFCENLSVIGYQYSVTPRVHC